MSGFYQSAEFWRFVRDLERRGWSGDTDSVRLLCHRAKRVFTLGEQEAGVDCGPGEAGMRREEALSARASELLPRAMELVAQSVADNLGDGWRLEFSGFLVRLFAPDEPDGSNGLYIAIS